MRLVGLLAVVAVLVVGAGIVIDAVTGPSGEEGAGGGILTPGLVPPGQTPRVPAPADPGSRVDEARAVSCASERRLVETALEQHRAVSGRYAPVDELVAAGWLRSAPAAWAVESDDDFATYRLTPIEPACAGR